jgi:Tol biopolymer transport system component
LLVALAASAAAPAAAPTSRIAFAADRAATEYGEIYRVAPDGTRIDLSRSPAADTAPASSLDGEHVAFVSVRGGRIRVYVVGSDARGLRAVSPPLAAVGPHGDPVAWIAWAPDNRRLAVVLGTSLHLTSIAGGWRTVARNAAPRPAAWSHDGERIAFATSAGLVQVLDTRTGRKLWNAGGGTGTPGWSSHGLLAIQQNSTTIAVYDAGGRVRSTFAGNAFAWSGDMLASDHLGTLELRAQGSGTPTLRVKLIRGARADDGAHVEWVTPTKIRLFDNRFVGYDVARRRMWALPAGAGLYGSAVSWGRLAASTQLGYPTASLRIGGRVVHTSQACGDDLPFAFIQFLGRTNDVVYQSGCFVPSADIYTVAPDGTGLTQVTNTPQHEFSPSLSPDGSRIAYVRQTTAARCDGCAQSLWLTSPTTQLTYPQDTDDAPFDVDPSWSPDGTKLVYSQSGADSPYEVMAIPAIGGAAQKLVAGSRPVWGPKLIAFEVDGTPPKLQTLDPITGAVTTVAITKGLDPSALAWSTDGRLAYLASAGAGRAKISIVGGMSFDVNAILPPKSIVTGLAWSPDGTRFAFVATDANGLGEVYTVATNGTGLRRVTKNADAVGNLSWR